MTDIKIWVVYFTEPETADQGEHICFSEQTANETLKVLEKNGINGDIHEEIVTDVEVVNGS